ATICTFFILLKEKPDILIVPNPSVVLSFISAVYKYAFKYSLIIDLHTHYINPQGLNGLLFQSLNRFSLKCCNLIIVTNSSYQEKIRDKTNNEIFILPDMIPTFDRKFKKVPLKGKVNILYVCTFSEDEPWEEVIKAGSLLSEGICVYITGKHNRFNKDILPSNIELTGFLPIEMYQNMLRSVDAIMVLTYEEDNLLCGGYEAIAAEKPLIISNKKVIKRFFSKGSVYTENIAKDIAEAIMKMFQHKDKLTEEMKSIKLIRDEEWKIQWNNFLNKIYRK
ncbi:glycosyltransferase, partial [Candidatus Scalindua japonica]